MTECVNKYSFEKDDDHINHGWKEIQKSTFTNWCNSILSAHNQNIKDLYLDLCDGKILVILYESVSGKKIDRSIKNPRVISQKLENINLVIREMRNDGIKIINIDPLDICHGNPKLTLALIWHLILYYQVGVIQSLNDSNENKSHNNNIIYETSKTSPKYLLIKLINALIPQSRVMNLTTDWNNGKLLGQLVEILSPGACSTYSSWDDKNALLNVTTALCLAEIHLGIPVLIEPHHMVTKSIDELSMITYLSSFAKEGGVLEKYMLQQLKIKFPVLNPIVNNMTTDWSTGIALCELVHACHYKAISKMYFTNFQNLTNEKDIIRESRNNIEYALKEAKKYLNLDICVDHELIILKKVPPLVVMTLVAPFLYIPIVARSAIKNVDSFIVTCSDNEPKLGSKVVIVLKSMQDMIKEKLKISTKLHNDNSSKIIDIHKIWKSLTECHIELYTYDEGKYFIEVDYNGQPLNCSPISFNVENTDISSSDFEIEGIDEINNFIGEPLIFTIRLLKNYKQNIEYLIERIGCKTRIKCESISMNGCSEKFRSLINKEGDYHLIIVNSKGQEMSLKRFTVKANIFDQIQLLSHENLPLSSDILHFDRCDKNINFKVNTRLIGNGILGIRLISLDSLKTTFDSSRPKVDIVNNSGIWDISLRFDDDCECNQYRACLTWNGYDVPDKHININLYSSDKIIIRNLSEFCSNNNVYKFQIYTRECGKINTIEGIFTNKLKKDHIKHKINITQIDTYTYEGCFKIAQVGSYLLKLYLNGNQIKNYNSVDVVDLSKITHEILSNVGFVGERIDVKVTITCDAGKGDIFYAMEGPDGAMKVFFEPLSKDPYQETYLLSSIPTRPGTYKLLLSFGSLPIIGFPKLFTVSSQPSLDLSLIQIDDSKLESIIMGYETQFSINLPRIPGNYVHGFYYYHKNVNNKIPIDVDLIENSINITKYSVKFTVNKMEDIHIRLFYGKSEIYRNNNIIKVLDINLIQPTYKFNEKVTIGQRYIFDIFVPCLYSYDKLDASIVSPQGEIFHPQIQKYDMPCANTSNIYGRDGLIYQLEFIPLEEGNYTIHLSYDNYSLVGYPKIFQAILPIPSFPDVTVSFQTDSFTIGKLNTIIIDARKELHGELYVSLYDPTNKQVEVEVTPIKTKGDNNCQMLIYQITFNLDKPGFHQLTVKWNDQNVKGSPFTLDAIMALPSLSVSSNQVIADSIVDETVSIIIENVYDRISNLDCKCFDPSRNSLTTSIKPHHNIPGACVLSLVPKQSGMHQVVINYNKEEIYGSPVYFKVIYPVNAANVKVYGPGLISGIFSPQKGHIFVQTDRAGSGLLQIAVQGPKDGFKLNLNDPIISEIDSQVTLVDYQPSYPGNYNISILWSGIHVPGSPFTVFNCRYQSDLEEFINENCIDTLSSPNNNYFAC